jgi:hypothetical protein
MYGLYYGELDSKEGEMKSKTKALALFLLGGGNA